MVFMYAINSISQGWWEKVTLIIWGAAADLAATNPAVQELIKKALEHGVHVTACKACTDQLGVSRKFEEMGIEVKYWGAPLTEILKNNEKLLTI